MTTLQAFLIGISNMLPRPWTPASSGDSCRSPEFGRERNVALVDNIVLRTFGNADFVRTSNYDIGYANAHEAL